MKNQNILLVSVLLLALGVLMANPILCLFGGIGFVAVIMQSFLY